MTVIYISGKARHGKDTVATFMQAQFEKDGLRTHITHYGDLVKFVAEKWAGWNGEKDEPGRRLLQYVGTDLIRAEAPGYWVAFVAQMAHFFSDEYDVLLIPDCRFPDELLWAPGYAVRVERTGPNGEPFDNGLSEAAKNHASETSLDDYPFRYVVHNDGGLTKLNAESAKLAAQIARYLPGAGAGPQARTRARTEGSCT